MMRLIFLLIFITAFNKDTVESYSSNVWYCRGAYIEFLFSNNTNLTNKQFDILYQYKICRECKLILLDKLNTENGINMSIEVSLESNYDYYFQVVFSNSNETVCPLFEYDKFDECGLWRLNISDINNCEFEMIHEPKNTYIYLYIAFGVIVFIVIIINILEKNWERIDRCLDRFKERNNDSLSERPVSLVTIKKEDNKDETLNENFNNLINNENKKRKKRVDSLDAFRGFSLVLMIMVIYGWEGYPIIHHLPWHGLNIGTLVFPWFLWIMGFSIPLSVHNVLKKPGASRIKLIIRIISRTIKMFFIGIVINTFWDGFDIDTLRIFGVLQRIGICYFFMAILEVIFYKKIELQTTKILFYLSDFIYSWKQTVIVVLLNIAWFLITFLLPVPGCPKGYFGPGGLEYDSKYFNCTGGAAGYIDKIAIGSDHLYKTSTPIKIYKNGFFDPEGILGTLTSIFLAYLGCQAGRVLLFYKNHRDQLILWLIWIILCLALFFGFTQGDLSNGFVPVNKNIWTFTFSLITAATGLGILFIFYILIDILGIWTGTPFKYPGLNSIFVYTFHIFFIFQFPVQWKFPPSFLATLIKSLWGVVFWTIVSVHLYRKKIFINL